MAEKLKYLSKFIVSVDFPEDSHLNLVVGDMGEGMVTFGVGEGVTRLETAVGSVASANVMVTETVTVEVKKTSPQYEAWEKQILKNGVLNGGCVVTDDVGVKHEYFDCSITRSDRDATAQTPSVTYVISGNVYYNKDLIV